MDNEKYVEKWLEGTLSEEEREYFETTEEFKSLEKLSGSVRAFKAPDYNVDVELVRLNEKKSAKGKVVAMPWLAPFMRMAAVFILICSSFFYFYLNVNTAVETQMAEKDNLFLPDSSRVDMNASTYIAYKKRLWNINRQVDLEGEAYFNVAKGSRFDVNTSVGVVSVLGTQFNVKNRGAFFEVVCYEGRVEVTGAGEIAQLKPGHFMRILKGNVTKGENIKDYSPSWLIGESSFTSVPYGEVIHEFERQYGVAIELNNIDNEKLFTGKFMHDDQQLALQTITLPFNLKFEITDGQRIILSNKSE